MPNHTRLRRYRFLALSPTMGLEQRIRYYMNTLYTATQDHEMTSAHYLKAPIIEALIEIQVIPRVGLSALDMLTGFDTIREEFPERQEISRNPGIILQFSSSESQLTPPASLSGIRFISQDKRYILQSRIDRFTLSMVCDPQASSYYTQWVDMKHRAQELWSIYVKSCGPVSVRQCALRYINRFDPPEDGSPVAGLFNNLPLLPIDNTDLLAGFWTNLATRQTKENAQTIINLGSVNSLITDSFSIIFDIEVSSLDKEWYPDSPDLWEYLDSLRDLKNSAFERYISDKAREVLS